MWIALVLALAGLFGMDDVLARLSALEATGTSLRARVGTLEDVAVRSVRAQQQTSQDALVRTLDPGPLSSIQPYRGGGDRLPALAQPLMARLMDDGNTGGLAAGRVDPTSSFGNVLGDPTFSTLPIGGTTLTAVANTNISDANPQWPYWSAWYVLNSGTAPATTKLIFRGAERYALGVGAWTDNVTSSSQATIDLDWAAAAGNITIYLLANDYANMARRLPSYLSAGIDVVLNAGVPTANVTSATAYVEIVDGTGATVYAQSDPEDLLALETIDLRSHIETALASPAASTAYYWRLRIDVVYPATAGHLYLDFNQPQLSWSEDGSLPQFTPAVGRWLPEAQRFHGARAYRTATQSINDVTDTAVLFDTGNAAESWDTDNFHSLASSSAQWAAPFTGYYHFDGGVGWAANATGVRDLWFELNADGIKRAQVRQINLNATQTFQTTSFDSYLTAGQYVRLMVRQNSGGALNVLGSERNTFVNVHLIGV